MSINSKTPINTETFGTLSTLTIDFSGKLDMTNYQELLLS